MSRRSRSQSNSKSHLAVYIIIGVAVIAALITGKFILDKRSQHFSELSDLSAADLKGGGTSLSGNKYRISGKITNRRNLSGDRGILISVTTEKDEKNLGPIPVYIPRGLLKINLERGQSYTFKVEIDREGLPVALDVKAQ